MDGSIYEDLLEESAWLRRLASALVRDPQDAEDVAQATWVAASGRGATPSRAWLATVARRAAGRLRRREGRRRDREALAAIVVSGSWDEHSESDSGPTRVAERLEVAERISKELKALPEPYRSTLFQRYFEGLEPTEIAKRAGIPPGTVRWRAQRGRELLREALCRDGTSWDTWLSALVPWTHVGLGVPSPMVATGIGVWTMGIKWVFVGLVLGGWLGFELEGSGVDPTPKDSAASRTTSEPGVRPDGRAQVGEGAVGQRDPVTPGPTEEWNPSLGTVAYGRVIDPEGNAVHRAAPILVDESGARAQAQASLDGGWSVHGLAGGLHRVEVHAWGFIPLVVEVDLPDTGPWSRDFVLTPKPSVPVTLLDPDGAFIATPYSDASPGATLLSIVATRAVPPKRLPAAPGTRIRRMDAGEFLLRNRGERTPPLEPRHYGLLRLEQGLPLYVSLAVGPRILETRLLETLPEELIFHVEPEELAPNPASLTVAAVDSTGQDLGGQPLLAAIPGGTQHKSIAGDRGFHFPSVPAGRYTLVWGDPGGMTETLRHGVTLEAGEALDLGTLVAGPAIAFRGRALDSLGDPVRLSPRIAPPYIPGNPWAQTPLRHGSLGKEGWIDFAFVGRREFRLIAGGASGFGLVGARIRPADGSSVELRLEPGHRVGFPSPRPLGVEFVLRSEDGVVLHGAMGIPNQFLLSTGAYRLELWNGNALVEEVPFRVVDRDREVQWSLR